jgi:hypothetical protein
MIYGSAEKMAKSTLVLEISPKTYATPSRGLALRKMFFKNPIPSERVKVFDPSDVTAEATRQTAW